MMGILTITFKVYSDKKDITEDARIYQDLSSGAVRMETPEFKTTEAGTYTFFATYKGQTSEKVLIVATTGDFPPLPSDPQPEKFNGFKHRLVATQFTGTGCGYCPNAISAIAKFKESEYADKMLFAASHSYFLIFRRIPHILKLLHDRIDMIDIINSHNRSGIYEILVRISICIKRLSRQRSPTGYSA